MNAKALISLFMLVAVVGGAIPVYYNDLLQVFESWRSGEPKVLIVLDIRVPQIDADKCVLAVMRYPSMFLPNNDTLENLFMGTVSPGSIVTVRKFIPAIPVKMRYDEAKKSYVVDYYDPQEFIVTAICVKGNTTVFKFGRNIEICPRNVVHREVVDIAALAEKYEKEERGAKTELSRTAPKSSEVGSLAFVYLDSEGDPPTFSCNIVITDRGDNYEQGECYTYIAGPYLYSINGITTSFGLLSGAHPSAVYIESFQDIKWVLDPNLYTLDWKSAGRKLAYSIVGWETPGLTGNSRVRVYFYVKFIYERYIYCAGNLPTLCYHFYYLYPYTICGLYGADQIGAGNVEQYTPPSTIPYYATLDYGSKVIYFAEAGRNGNQYTTPYVRISAPSNFYYYWWFKDNDAMTYEVLFAPAE